MLLEIYRRLLDSRWTSRFYGVCFHIYIYAYPMETHRLLREMFQKLSCSFDPLQVADQRARWASGSMASNTLSAAGCPGFCWWCPNAPWDLLVGGWIFTYYHILLSYIIMLIKFNYLYSIYDYLCLSLVKPGSFILTLVNPQANDLLRCQRYSEFGGWWSSWTSFFRRSKSPTSHGCGCPRKMIAWSLALSQSTRPDQKIPPQRSACGLSHRLISILPWMILDDEYFDGRASRIF